MFFFSPDGTMLGEHKLLNDRANEQPFTRTQTGLEITIEGHDQEYGYGGKNVAVDRG